ncbi:MAG: ATPase, T2SS/T4P/T4SS family [Betaproteobacteria bacterium]
MIHMTLTFEDGKQDKLSLEAPFVIGRSAQCALRIQHWRVAKAHLRVRRDHTGCYLEDLGSLGGTRVNGNRLARYGPVQETDEVVVGPCLLRFAMSEHDGAEANAEQPVFHIRAPEVRHLDSIESSRFDRALRRSLHLGLIKALDLRRTDIASLTPTALRDYARECARQLPFDLVENISDIDKDRLIELVVVEAVGLGVLEPLLADPTITEIMVNAFDEIYVECNGALMRSDVEFSSDVAVRGIIERIVFPLGRRIDELSPMVDARLPDGSRLNAVISPISLRGACVTIRKFPKTRPSLDDLVQNGTLAQPLAKFLNWCVVNRINILVSGGTGSGKTTLLNVLANQIPSVQRIVTIEDSAELQISHPHVVKLEARPPSIEGRGAITICDLVKNALRMRPDRIVVGEVRGAEATDMLVAMNTGHEGSLTTLHANSPRDALARLETLMLAAQSGLPHAAIREQIASAIHLIVHQARLQSGQRVVHAVAEVCGVESGVIQTQTIVRMDIGSGRARGAGLMPTLFDRLNYRPDSHVADWFVLA